MDIEKDFEKLMREMKVPFSINMVTQKVHVYVDTLSYEQITQIYEHINTLDIDKCPGCGIPLIDLDSCWHCNKD